MRNRNAMIDPQVSSYLEAMNELETSLLQVRALITMTYGEGGVVFRRMSDDVQDNFLWGVNSLVDKAVSSLKDANEWGTLLMENNK